MEKELCSRNSLSGTHLRKTVCGRLPELRAGADRNHPPFLAPLLPLLHSHLFPRPLPGARLKTSSALPCVPGSLPAQRETEHQKALLAAVPSARWASEPHGAGWNPGLRTRHSPTLRILRRGLGCVVQAGFKVRVLASASQSATIRGVYHHSCYVPLLMWWFMLRDV